MIPKSERLTKQDFNGLRPKIIFRGTYVDVAVSKSEVTKFACIVSKKRIKKATDRNTAKRRVYSILRDVRPKNNFFVLLYPKQNAISGEFLKIKEEISQAFDTID
ncbi:MAG: Ribonuclease [Candidatus Nomurabacteria bacterium]|nr:Ribonuclease [Candidatus Nomurabacteria bacterium]